MSGCKHYYTEDICERVDIGEGITINEFKGYKHGCHKNPEGYNKWWEDNANKPSFEAYDMDCFEPTDLTASLMKANELAQQILDKIKKNKENKE